MQGDRIYLDYAAATPLDERVIAVMDQAVRELWANPSSPYELGRSARQALEEGRERLAAVIGARADEIIITAGATESINLAIHGVMRRYGGRVLVASTDHAAARASAHGYDHNEISADRTGYLQPELLARVLSRDVTLISVAYINNELGTVQSLRRLRDTMVIERERRRTVGETRPLLLHVDASQALGVIDVSVSRLGVDMMTLSGSKCYGPRQAGLLWRRPEIELMPVIAGGGQENGLRSGTENVPVVLGFATAAEIADASRASASKYLAKLRRRLAQKLITNVPDIMINGHSKRHAPHILHVSLPGLDGERAVYGCDLAGVQVATGSACAANRGTASHVLVAVGFDEAHIRGSLRFSLGREMTEDSIDRAADIIARVMNQERGK